MIQQFVQAMVFAQTTIYATAQNLSQEKNVMKLLAIQFCPAIQQSAAVWENVLGPTFANAQLAMLEDSANIHFVMEFPETTGKFVVLTENARVQIPAYVMLGTILQIAYTQIVME